MTTIRCKVRIGTDSDVEIPDSVPMIYGSGRSDPLSGSLKYATLERIGSEVWATFDLPEDRVPRRITATASLVIPPQKRRVERFLGKLWVIAIIVKVLPLSRISA